MPVVVMLDDHVRYEVVYSVAGWSPILIGDDDAQIRHLIAVMRHTRDVGARHRKQADDAG